ncbi:MAG: glycosyltransferase [Ilumatobacteraceae bacterium]
MTREDQRSPAGSIVIPAWNEAALIGTTLRALFDGVDTDAFEVVVACNGCTDGTEAVVTATGLPVTLLSLPPVGKHGAIVAAEQVATTLPRLYLDADIAVPGSSALATLRAMRDGAVAARPPLTYDTSGAAWLVRRYYAARRRLRSVTTDLCGAGVYGLSETARGRFDEFPAVVADDLFAARIVSRDEVVIVDCPPAVVRTPRRARDLLRTLTRVYRGNAALAATMPEAASTASSTGRELLRVARDPRAIIDVSVYVGFVLLARVVSRRAGDGWQRDDSSRATVETSV